nr:MAG TPA: hypothetical protein [Caudoviricetes sp.]
MTFFMTKSCGFLYKDKSLLDFSVFDPFVTCMLI